MHCTVYDIYSNFFPAHCCELLSPSWIMVLPFLSCHELACEMCTICRWRCPYQWNSKEITTYCPCPHHALILVCWAKIGSRLEVEQFLLWSIQLFEPLRMLQPPAPSYWRHIGNTLLREPVLASLPLHVQSLLSNLGTSRPNPVLWRTFVDHRSLWQESGFAIEVIEPTC